MWKNSLQNVYDSADEFAQYDELYGLAGRLGYDSAYEAWEDNPLIMGSTNPADFCKVEFDEEEHRQLVEIESQMDTFVNILDNITASGTVATLRKGLQELRDDIKKGTANAERHVT